MRRLRVRGLFLGLPGWCGDPCRGAGGGSRRGRQSSRTTAARDAGGGPTGEQRRGPLLRGAPGDDRDLPGLGGQIGGAHQFVGPRLQVLAQQGGRDGAGARRSGRGQGLVRERFRGRFRLRRVLFIALHDLQRHDGDVVRRAAGQGQLDQFIDHVPQISTVSQLGLDHGGGHHRGQAVRTEQPALAGGDLQRGDVQLGGGVHVSEHAHEHILVGVGLGIVRVQPTFVHQALDEGVVLGDLGELILPETVGA